MSSSRGCCSSYDCIVKIKGATTRPILLSDTVTDPAHRPPGHRWFAKRMDDRFLALAREEGANVVRVMKHVLSACKKEGKGFRACKELIDLRKTPSAAGVTLDEACRAVLDGGGEIGVAEVMKKLAGDAE